MDLGFEVRKAIPPLEYAVGGKESGTGPGNAANNKGLISPVRGLTLRFLERARNALEESGFVIYELTGASIAQLRKRGKKFGSNYNPEFDDELLSHAAWQLLDVPPHKARESSELIDKLRVEFRKFESRPSRVSEVAIKPERYLLTNDDAFDYPQLQQSIVLLSRKLGIEGIEVVIGSVADHLELYFTHLKSAGKPLFKFSLTEHASGVLTETRVLPDFAEFGNAGVYNATLYQSLGGVYVASWSREHPCWGKYVAPLVFPFQASTEPPKISGLRFLGKALKLTS